MIIVASENHNAASFSRFERTDFVGHPEGCGAVSVSAVIVSSMLMPIYMQASAIVRGIEPEKQLPGLRSVANATAAPASINLRAGAKGSFKAKGS